MISTLESKLKSLEAKLSRHGGGRPPAPPGSWDEFFDRGGGDDGDPADGRFRDWLRAYLIRLIAGKGLAGALAFHAGLPTLRPLLHWVASNCGADIAAETRMLSASSS